MSEANATIGIGEDESNPFANARVLLAFAECSRPIQEIVLEMAIIIADDKSDQDDRETACDAMMEALFPGTTADTLGEYRIMLQSPEAAEAARQLRGEEEGFATCVRRLMKQRNITQDDLAQAAGIGQSAVSNILNRRCRPQRRTVAKFADAFNVSPAELWPEFDSATP